VTDAEFERQLVNKIVCGDALAILKEMPSGAVNCCISSPPYW
jgi:DNA modification methylase